MTCCFSVVPFREDLFVSLQDGWLHHISWGGVVDTSSFHLFDVSFAVDQLQSKSKLIQKKKLKRGLSCFFLVSCFIESPFLAISRLIIVFAFIFSAERVQEPGVHVVDMAYAPLIGGLSIVLSNGTAALLTSPSSRFISKVMHKVIHTLLLRHCF